MELGTHGTNFDLSDIRTTHSIFIPVLNIIRPYSSLG